MREVVYRGDLFNIILGICEGILRNKDSSMDFKWSIYLMLEICCIEYKFIVFFIRYFFII